MRRRYTRRRHARAAIWLPVLAALMLCAYLAGRMGGNGAAPAAQPAATAETSRIVMDAYTFYAIQFGAFDNDADARALTQSYVSRGAAGYVLTDTRSRAIGAAYTSRSDADKVCANLAAQGIDSYVYTVSGPRIELRVTASRELTEAIRAGHAASLAAIDELGRTALELDGGGISISDAVTALSRAGDAAGSARTRLESALSGRTHAVTGGMLSELRAAEDACEALIQQNTQSAMAFSAKIKYNVIDLMQRHVQFMQMLIQPAASA